MWVGFGFGILGEAEQQLQHLNTSHNNKSFRHELLESDSSEGFRRSSEKANGGALSGVDLSTTACRSGRFSAEVWLEAGGEKGGEGD